MSLDNDISVLFDCVFALPQGPILRGPGLESFYPSVPQSEKGVTTLSLAMAGTGDWVCPVLWNSDVCLETHRSGTVPHWKRRKHENQRGIMGGPWAVGMNPTPYRQSSGTAWSRDCSRQPKLLVPVGYTVVWAMVQQGTALNSHLRTLEKSGQEHLWRAHMPQTCSTDISTSSLHFILAVSWPCSHIFTKQK